MFRHGVGLADLLLLVYIVGLFSTTSETLEPSYRYDTAYACEGKTLKIECRDGELIKLIRANYGRFSITICNDHGNTEWSVNCMSPKSLRVLLSRCSEYQNCSIPASTSMFGDPCPGTLKYLEAHYQCLPASTTTTTSRPSPPWLVTSQPPMWSTVKTSSRPGSGPDIPVAVIPAGAGVQPALPPPNKAPTKASSTTVSAAATSSASSSATATATSRSPVDTTSSLHGGGVSSIPVRVGVGFPSGIDAAAGDNDEDDDNVDEGIAADAGVGSTTIRPRKYHAYGETGGGNPPDSNNNHRQPSAPSIASTASTSASSSSAAVASADDYCAPTTQRNIYWNWTRAGQINIQSCPGGTTGFARWRCVRPGARPGPSLWSPPTPDLSECRSVWLTSLEQRVLLGKDPLISITSDLAQVTSSKTLYGGDMMITTKIIQKMAQKMNMDIQTVPDPRQREAIVTEMLSDVVRTGSNLLDSTQHLSWRDLSHKEQMRVATSLLIGLEENAFLLADTIMRVKTLDQMVKNIMLSVRVLDARSVTTEVFPTPGDGRWSTSNDTIELPQDALLENSDGGLVRLVFVAFDRLEEILRWHPTDTGVTSSQSASISSAMSVPQSPDDSNNGLNVSRMLNSKVISASLGKGRHIQLRESVRLTLRHLYTENVSNPTCVFWDYTTSAWSEEGCYVEFTNRTHTVCLCNHLTNFAILMDVHAVYLPPGHQIALQIITYIGCSISIICLLFAIITFQLVRGLKSDRTTIHCNLSACLLIAEFIFVAFIDSTHNRVFCSAVAAFMQYFFLCAFMWMFFEGFQLYVMLIEVFEAEKSRIRWYYVIAYTVPALIVGTAYAVYPQGYGSELHCWLQHDNYFIFTFIVPVVVIIMLNIVFLSMAIVTMCRHTNSTVSMKNKEHSRLASARVWLRGAFVLMFLLGITWTFGLLYINAETVAMAYVFSIANSLQGFFIFFFHCVQNDKARKEYRRFIRRHSWLPACLRCSSSRAGAGNATCAGAVTGTGNTGSGSACSSDNNHHHGTAQHQASGSGSTNTSNTTHAPRPLLYNSAATASTAVSQPTADRINGLSGSGGREPDSPTSINNAAVPQSATCYGGNDHHPVMATLQHPQHAQHQLNQHLHQSDQQRYQQYLSDQLQQLQYIDYAAQAQAFQQNHHRQGRKSRSSGGGTSPYHTYSEIHEARLMHQQQQRRAPPQYQHHHHHHPDVEDDDDEDDPVYEEIERAAAAAAVAAAQSSVTTDLDDELDDDDDMDEDTEQRQSASDMSRQSSRSYGDHRPLIPAQYSPSSHTNAAQPQQQQRMHYHPDAMRSLAAVLDGQTVVCHLEPADQYGARLPSSPADNGHSSAGRGAIMLSSHNVLDHNAGLR